MTVEPPFTAEQIQSSIVKAFRDGEPEKVKQSLLDLLAIHYPSDFKQFAFAVELARWLAATEGPGMQYDRDEAKERLLDDPSTEGDQP